MKSKITLTLEDYDAQLLDKAVRIVCLLRGDGDEPDSSNRRFVLRWIVGAVCSAIIRNGEMPQQLAVERRHEIPYGMPGVSDLPSMGVIDLVYRVNDRGWIIVDFKTDDIRDDAEFEKVKGKYASQIHRYREAFRRLLGQPAESWLCFLNYNTHIRWEKI